MKTGRLVFALALVLAWGVGVFGSGPTAVAGVTFEWATGYDENDGSGTMWTVTGYGSGPFNTFLLTNLPVPSTGNYAYSISDTIGFGSAEMRDLTISAGAAYLYSEFLSGNSAVAVTTDAQASAFQQAIWMLQGEVQPDGGNTYYSYVTANYPGDATADAAGLYGIQIMTLNGAFTYVDEDTGEEYSYGVSAYVLVKTSDGSTSVPEPGTLLLLGVAMVGLGALQLRKKV